MLLRVLSVACAAVCFEASWSPEDDNERPIDGLCEPPSTSRLDESTQFQSLLQSGMHTKVSSLHPQGPVVVNSSSISGGFGELIRYPHDLYVRWSTKASLLQAQVGRVGTFPFSFEGFWKLLGYSEEPPKEGAAAPAPAVEVAPSVADEATAGEATAIEVPVPAAEAAAEAPTQAPASEAAPPARALEAAPSDDAVEAAPATAVEAAPATAIVETGFGTAVEVAPAVEIPREEKSASLSLVHSDMNLCLNGRLVPELFVIGAQKSGTTSLASELSSGSADIILPESDEDYEKKEPHSFDWKYDEGEEHWLSRWPPCQQDRRVLAVDMTPVLHTHICVPCRIRERYGELSGRLKFIVLLRNPVERMQSAFYHGQAGFHEDW